MDIDGYTIKLRTSKRAKRLSLSSRGSVITLTRPKHVPEAIARAFAYRNRSWIEKHARTPMRYEGLQKYGSIAILFEQSNKKRHIWRDDRLVVFGPDQLSRKTQLKHALRERTRSIVYQYVDIWADNMKLEPEKIRIADTISRWGSCSSRGTLSFSIYLAQLPAALQQYIVIHELAHLDQPNHGKQFWRLVEEYDASYTRHKKELKQYSLGL